MKNQLYRILYLFFITSCTMQAQGEDYPPIDSITGLRVYTIVEQMPCYLEGESEMLKFINKNMKIPLLDEPYDEYGIITGATVKFVVDADGNVMGERVYARINKKIKPKEKYNAVDIALIEVIKTMPKWKAGMHEGKAVPVFFTIPMHINFR